jgi:hypothetical protein
MPSSKSGNKQRGHPIFGAAQTSNAIKGYLLPFFTV